MAWRLGSAIAFRYVDATVWCIMYNTPYNGVLSSWEFRVALAAAIAARTQAVYPRKGIVPTASRFTYVVSSSVSISMRHSPATSSRENTCIFGVYNDLLYTLFENFLQYTHHVNSLPKLASLSFEGKKLS